VTFPRLGKNTFLSPPSSNVITVTGAAESVVTVIETTSPVVTLAGAGGVNTGGWMTGGILSETTGIIPSRAKHNITQTLTVPNVITKGAELGTRKGGYAELEPAVNATDRFPDTNPPPTATRNVHSLFTTHETVAELHNKSTGNRGNDDGRVIRGGDE
jgi:hypothetical protein